MLECDPDCAPSLNLGHTEVKATSSDRFKWYCRRARSSQQQQPPPPATDNAGPETELDNAAPLSPDYTAPVSETQPTAPAPDKACPEIEMEAADEQHECMCRLRHKEIICLQEENTKWAPSDEQECSCMCRLRHEEIIRLQEDNRKLKEELSKKRLDENFLKDNDSKVKYYTGLPVFSLLMAVLIQILPSH